ncbi:clavesin-2-like [Brevipalpus obovatus]|uniref:clavesin-2-like n=1 Tax=Brevipalpus obovatus TaxID=246614 RepID=UPI003D9F0D90
MKTEQPLALESSGINIIDDVNDIESVKKVVDSGPESLESLESIESTICPVDEFRNEFIKSHKMLSKYEHDDIFLERMLLFFRGDINKTLKALCDYINIVQNHANFFIWPDMEHIMEQDVVLVSNLRLPDGRAIGYGKVGNWLPDKLTLVDIARFALATSDAEMIDKELVVHGFDLIIDVKGLSWWQIPHLTIGMLRLLHDYHKLFGHIVHEVHVVNESYWLNIAYNIVKPFLLEEFRKKIHFHGNGFTKLHERYSTSVLPPEYGGTYTGEYSTKVNAERHAKLRHITENRWNAYKQKK